MCGIVGWVGKTPRASETWAEEREATLRLLGHRGPDSHGQFVDGQVWLGHVRLAIIDLSAEGCQPMTSDGDRWVIAYNGEVYNFAELAQSLALQDLRSHSDTEVVLRAFALLGLSAVKRFNGMFAFAIYDRLDRRVWLVRDRLGIKPLYYRFEDEGLAFASEIKALPPPKDGVARCDVGSLHEWLYYGTALGERTMHAGVRKLLPGHCLEVDLDAFAVRNHCYWSVADYAGRVTGAAGEEDHIARTRMLLEAAVKRQLVSDVPIGVFLSGGVDSSAITAFAARHHVGKLTTYSAGFDFDNGVNELPKAREIAALYGTDHHELMIKGDAIADLVELMVDHHDSPFGDAANVPLYLMSAQVRSMSKVILQGDGGDELFGGYDRYTTLSHIRWARLVARVGRAGNALTRHTSSHFRRRRYINALLADSTAEQMAKLLTEEDMADQPERVFQPAFRKAVTAADPFARYRECQALFSGDDLVNQMLSVDAMIILPEIFLEKVDRATMAAGVEVRVPFLDNDLVDFSLRLTGPEKVHNGRKKWLLKKALEGVVPMDVLYGKKTGFGVPYGYWLRHALRPLFLDQLATMERLHPGVLEGQVVREMLDAHAEQRQERSFLLWKILNFMIWATRRPICFEISN